MVKRGDGRVSVWMKAPEGAREVLVAAAPEWFFRPPYVGHKGWISIRLDTGADRDGVPDWDEVAGHVRRSYGLIAPRKLAKLME